MATSGQREKRTKTGKSAGQAWKAYRWSILVVAAVSAICLGLLAWSFVSVPEPNTLYFEGAKTVLQATGLVVLGAIVGAATYNYQAKTGQLAAKAEGRRRRADSKRDRKRQEFDQMTDRTRREIDADRDRLRDDRQRNDEFLKAVLEVCISNYHDVKRVRRTLRAKTMLASGERSLGVELYDQEIGTLIDAQLRFERLKRVAPLIEHAIDDPNGCGLADHFKQIEEYLHDLSEEYESSRWRVLADGNSINGELPRLSSFLESKRDGDFHTLTDSLGQAIRLLRNSILRPGQVVDGVDRPTEGSDLAFLDPYQLAMSASQNGSP